MTAAAGGPQPVAPPYRRLPLEMAVHIGAGAQVRRRRLHKAGGAVPVHGPGDRVVDAGGKLDEAVPVTRRIAVAPGVARDAGRS